MPILYSCSGLAVQDDPRRDIQAREGAWLCRYGLIDRIVQPQDAVAMDEKNYEAMLQKSQAQQRGGPRQTEGAEAGY